jgi:uncharacterized protein (TIGR02145 family)
VSASAADDNGAGTSWETAKRTLGAALAMAGNSSNVYVMVGEYLLEEELIIPAGVTVTGGYASGSTGTDVSQRHNPGGNSNWGNFALCTILSGNYTHRIATVNTGGTLESCVVRFGRTTGNGGGILLNGGTLSHCVIMNSIAYDPVGQTEAKGGGVYMQSGSLLNCVVCYNRADNGYGVAGMGGNAVNNTVTQNFPMNCGTVTDYDQNEYATVVIGNQCWMRENLRTTHFADGTAISAGQTTSTTTALYYNPATVGAETHIFGLLYNLRAARRASHDSFTDDNPSGVQGVCPEGWHLPSNAEFEQLLAFLRHDAANTCGGNDDNLAKSLAVDSLWLASSVTCAVGNGVTENNLSLFSAPPAGYYDESFHSLYQQGRFWTTSRANNVNSHCVYRGVSYNTTTLEYGFQTAEKGCSVRCVKDE